MQLVFTMCTQKYLVYKHVPVVVCFTVQLGVPGVAGMG